MICLLYTAKFGNRDSLVQVVLTIARPTSSMADLGHVTQQLMSTMRTCTFNLVGGMGQGHDCTAVAAKARCERRNHTSHKSGDDLYLARNKDFPVSHSR